MEKDSTSLTSSFTLPLWTPPPEGKPTFPTSMATHRWGEGVAEIENHASRLDQLIGEDDRNELVVFCRPHPQTDYSSAT